MNECGCVLVIFHCKPMTALVQPMVHLYTVNPGFEDIYTILQIVTTMMKSCPVSLVQEKSSYHDNHDSCWIFLSVRALYKVIKDRESRNQTQSLVHT